MSIITDAARLRTADEIESAVNAAWERRIIQFGRELRERWERFSADIDGLAEIGELVEDDAGGIFGDFLALTDMGVRFDPYFILKMERLHAGLAAVVIEEGADVDDGYENEDPNQDDYDELHCTDEEQELIEHETDCDNEGQQDDALEDETDCDEHFVASAVRDDDEMWFGRKPRLIPAFDVPEEGGDR